MTDTSTITPSALLIDVEKRPFPERLRYVAGLPAPQRRALRVHLDTLTNLPSAAAGASRYQSERLAIMMALDGLERSESARSETFPGRTKKRINKGAAAAVAVVVVVVIIAAFAKTASPPRDPTTSNPYVPSYTSPPSGVVGGTQVTASWLQSEIDAGREELRPLESRLRSMRNDLDLLENRLSSFKAEIEREERNAQLGLYVNEYAYRAALRNYNAIVPQYNVQLQTYNSRHADYERVLNRTNQLIDQYNARLRR